MEEQKMGKEECFGEMPQGVPQGMPRKRLGKRLKKCFGKWLGECPQGFKTISLAVNKILNAAAVSLKLC